MSSLNADLIKSIADLDKYTIVCHETVTSTNDIVKDWAKNGAEHNSVLVAECQTKGRGKYDRVFFSPDKTGVYFSILLRPDLSAKDAKNLTVFAAVAVAMALDEISVSQAQIKWVNDIYINDKKVCGILTEASFNFAQNTLDWAVVGIGINIFPPKCGFPSDIALSAGAVTDDCGEDSRNKIVGRILYYFDKVINSPYDFALSEFKKRSWLDGKTVKVIDINTEYTAEVIGISDDMSLSVMTQDGQVVQLISGEVSVKA